MTMHRHFAPSLLSLLSLLALAACEGLPGWLGGPEEPPLPGDRISVLPKESGLKTDPGIQDVTVTVPAAAARADWPQEGGNAANDPGNVVYGGAYSSTQSASVGRGNGWENELVPSPVTNATHIFAMDAQGYVSAHRIGELGKQDWRYDGLVDPDGADALGGGLAHDDSAVYAVSGRGDIAALNAATGAMFWKQPLKIPLRSAPRVAGGMLYVLSVDNQLFALDAATGNIAWTQRGIAETASYLSLVTPAADQDTVIAPYSSGEIKALKSGSGDEAWSDALTTARRTSASSIFTGIDANPVIHDGIVYAVGNGGLMAATALANGRRVWDQDISSRNTPLVAGNFVYVLSSESELVCLQAVDGRIRWVSALPRFADSDKKKPYSWSGPLMLSDKLVVTGAHGVLLGFNPEDGAQTFEKDIPSGIHNAPLVVGDTLYVLTQSAKLHALK